MDADQARRNQTEHVCGIVADELHTPKVIEEKLKRRLVQNIGKWFRPDRCQS